MRTLFIIEILTIIVLVTFIGISSYQYHHPIQQMVTPVTIPVGNDYEKMCAERMVWVENAILNEPYNVDPIKASKVAGKIAYASVIEGVPVEYLTSIIDIESEFNQNAKSHAGAIGYTQVIPEEWKNEIPYNIYNEQGNILAGAWVLKRYYLETKSWTNAVKAYNIGITNFKKGKQKDSAERFHKKVTKNLEATVAYNEVFTL